MYILGPRALTILGNFLIFNKVQKVFLPANFCPVVFALLGSLNIRIKALDLTPDLLNLNIDPLMNFLTENSSEVTALLLGNTYGALNKFNEDNTKELKAAGLSFIIDDRCLCVPEFDNFWADLTLFSFGYSKFIQLQQGGAVGFVKKSSNYRSFLWSYDKNLFTRVDRALRSYHDPYEVGKRIGNISWVLNGEENLSLKLNDVIKNVPILVEKTLEQKLNLNSIYHSELGSESVIDILDDSFQFWRFNILIQNSTLIIEKLFKAGLFASNHYKTYDKSCQNSADLSRKVVNLFNGVTESEEFCLACCDVILKGSTNEE